MKALFEKMNVNANSPFSGKKRVLMKILAWFKKKLNYPVWLGVCCRKGKILQTRIFASSQRQSNSSQPEGSQFNWINTCCATNIYKALF